jgi:hypothetical protein
LIRLFNVSFLSDTTITGGTVVPFVTNGVFTPGNTIEYTVTASPAGTIGGTLGSGTQIFAGLTITVPEPASLGFLSLGGLALVSRRRRA